MLYFLPSIEFNIKICSNKKFNVLQKTELFFHKKNNNTKNQCGKIMTYFKEDLKAIRKNILIIKS